LRNGRVDAEKHILLSLAAPSIFRDSQSFASSDVSQFGAISPDSAISKALKRLNAAAAAAKVLARNERNAALASQAVLFSVTKSKNDVVSRADSAIKAASAATAEAKALKEQLARATNASQRLSKEARAAQNAYIAGRRAAEAIKTKASAMTKHAVSLLHAAEAAAAKAAVAKKSLLSEEANLVAARKKMSDNSFSLQKLSEAFTIASR